MTEPSHEPEELEQPEEPAEPAEDRSFRNALIVGLAPIPMAGAIALLSSPATMVDVCWSATLGIMAAFAIPAVVLARRGAREMSRDEPERRGKLTAMLCAVAFVVALSGASLLAYVVVPVVDCKLDKSAPQLVHARLVHRYRTGRTLNAEYELTGQEAGGTFSVKSETEKTPEELDVKVHKGALGARWVDPPYFRQ